MNLRTLTALAALIAVALAADPAAAQSTAAIDGTVVTLHVPIDLIGMDDYEFKNPETGRFTDSATDVAETMQQRANALWNDQLAALQFLDCFTFRVEIELHPLPSGHAGNPGHHHVLFTLDPTFRSYVQFPPGAPPRGDSATMFDAPGGGEWSLVDISNPWVLAHESGHLLGLEDDYTDVGGTFRGVSSVPKPGRQGTMMDGGPAVDRDLVDRLGRLLDQAGIPLPACWKGTIESDTSRTYRDANQGLEVGTCTDRWQTELTFTDHDGLVRGSASMNLVAGPDCTFPVHSPIGVATLVATDVVGTATEDEFRLQLEAAAEAGSGAVLGGVPTLYLIAGCPLVSSPGPEIVVPRTGAGEARAEVELSARLACAGSANDDFTSTNRIELQQVTLSDP